MEDCLFLQYWHHFPFTTKLTKDRKKTYGTGTVWYGTVELYKYPSARRPKKPIVQLPYNYDIAN